MGEDISYWVVVYRCLHPTRTVSQHIMKACKCKHILNCEVQLSKQETDRHRNERAENHGSIFSSTAWTMHTRPRCMYPWEYTSPFRHYSSPSEYVGLGTFSQALPHRRTSLTMCVHSPVARIRQNLSRLCCMHLNRRMSLASE
jgi:hypothetical protein